MSQATVAASLLVLLAGCHGDGGDGKPGVVDDTGTDTEPSTQVDDTGAPVLDTGDPDETTEPEPSVGGPEIFMMVPTSIGALEHPEAVLDVSGVASVGVTEVRWSTDVGASGVADGTDQWSASVALSVGPQLVTVTATDADGLQGSTARWVLREGLVDFEALSLEPEVAAPGSTVEVRLQLNSTVSEASVSFDCGDGAVVSALSGSDDIWTGTLTAPGAAAQCIVQAEADGERSLPELLRVQAPLTEADAAVLIATLEETSEAILAGALLPDLATALQERSDVLLAGANDRKLWWVSASGILHGITVTDADQRGGGAGSRRPLGLPLTVPGPGIHPDPEMRFFSAYSDEFAPWDEVPAWLVPNAANQRYCGRTPTVTHLDRSAVTASSLLTMNGTTHISTHGEMFWSGACSFTWPLPSGVMMSCPSGWGGGRTGEELALFTREIVTPALVASYASDLSTWRMAIGGTVDPATSTHQNFFTVQPGYFQQHIPANGLEGAVVTVAACMSARNPSLYKVLMSKGAQAYIGFDDYVGSQYAHDFLTTMYTQWWTGGQDLSAAFADAVATVGAHDPSSPFSAAVLWEQSRVLPPGPMSVLSNADHLSPDWSWVETCLEDIDGQINTSGGDAVLTYAPGDGGDVRMVFDPTPITTAPTGTNLVVQAGATQALSAGSHVYDEVWIDGTLELNGDVTLEVRGSLYVSASGAIIAASGASLDVDAGGVVVIDGRVDLSGAHAYSSSDTVYLSGGSLTSCYYDTDGASGPGGDGGTLTIRQHSEPLVVPTITALGGDGSDYDPDTSAISGGSGGAVEITAASGRAYFVGGAVDPNLWTLPTVSKTHRPYGCDLSGHMVSAIQPNLPFFDGGIVTAGGQGPMSIHSGSAADASGYGGDGGSGGDVTITASSGSLWFWGIDIVTGGSVNLLETAPSMHSLDDQASFANAQGSQGGYGNFGSLNSGGEGGNGGDAGDITITGSTNIGALASQTPFYGWDGDNPNDYHPSGSPPHILGYEYQYVDHLNVPAVRAWAVGGSGGSPGGTSVSTKFPGWFGYAGAEGTITVTP